MILRALIASLKRSPLYALRLINVAFSPHAFLKKAVLAFVLQFIARFVAKAIDLYYRAIGIQNPHAVLKIEAKSLAEWQQQQQQYEFCVDEPPIPRELSDYCRRLEGQAATYERLAKREDMHGLMFLMRSQLMRSQAGGRGYSRDGNVAFRKHPGAIKRIAESQKKIMEALEYVASGTPTYGPSIAERLSFVNETRLAFGHTALLLSGGAALGFKHSGVLKALHREGLLPRVISGSSAGSIAAAAVCVRDGQELTRLVEGGFMAHVVRTIFFGVKRTAESLSHLEALDPYPVQKPASIWKGIESGRLPESLSRSRRGSMPDLTDVTGGVTPQKLAKNLGTGSLLDQSTLEAAILPLVGELTFLEAFDVSGRILNICVSPADGKAESLMCNYLTTPQMLVLSACLASCAIPGVYEPVELMAKDRAGHIVPYFQAGDDDEEEGPGRGRKWLFTDGGMQDDLPKGRLSELFNVNQFIVSQVNPFSALFLPVNSGVPFLQELMALLKNQLLGFAQGVSQLADGQLVRPGGHRAIDIAMQDYLGTVTVFPHWEVTELSGLISNCDAPRLEQYELDGQRAVWPQLQVIKSLCEIEFKLSRVSAQLTDRLAAQRSEKAGLVRSGAVPSPAGSANSLQDTVVAPRRPQSLMFALGGGDSSGEEGVSGKGMEQRLQSTSSFASLLSLGAV